MNAVSTHQRKYKLKARADRQRQTRERIVAATSALHQEVGPARTTIADVARRAGVQRLTVYNTFPKPADLFAACQAHFLAGSPPPDLQPGEGGDNPSDQLEERLAGLYAWYRTNQAMERHVHRDRHLVPELDQLMRETADRGMDAVATAYLKLIGGAGARRTVRPIVRLALEFETWAVLAGEGLTDGEIAALMRRAVDGVGIAIPDNSG
jgi:AcrR family transcriptional regulator